MQMQFRAADAVNVITPKEVFNGIMFRHVSNNNSMSRSHRSKMIDAYVQNYEQKELS